MSDLAALERAKRRRLQETYADLRPSTGTSEDDRQARLRHLLLGASVDAGPSAGTQPSGAVRGSSTAGRPEAVLAMATATAASIASVERRIPNRRGASGSTGGSSCGAGTRASVLSPGGSAGTLPSQAYGGPSSRGGRGGRCTSRAPPPPPGAMDGGFLHEVDPIQRLSRIQLPFTAAAGSPPAGPAAAVGSLGRSAVGGAGPGPLAAAAQWYHMYNDDDDGDAETDVPSDVELALMALKSDLRSHPASADLPPMALRSQLSCLLTDRSTVERQLDEQRRANRVRVFKLPTGTDEFGVLITSDYRAIVRQAADGAAASAAAATTAASQPRQQQAPPSGVYGAPVVPRAGTGSRWHVAVEAFLCRVVDRFTDFELSRDHLLHLLRTALPPTTNGQPPQPAQDGQRLAVLSGTARGQQGNQRCGAGPSEAASAAGASETPSLEALEDQVSLLLHLGCLARHTDGDADAYVLAVPGAGKLVKAVQGGRRELLTWLSKRQHREAPEEQVCKLKLRSSCLPPLYHVRDLVGRGAAGRVEGTCGPVIKLPAGSAKKAG